MYKYLYLVLVSYALLKSPRAHAVNSNGFILPNFYSIHIGERGGSLGGAVVARIDDASSAYYNPAGLTLLPKDSFSASGSTYSTSDLKITGSTSKNDLNSIASYVANVIKYKDYYLAFSIATPIYSKNSLKVPTVDKVIADVEAMESYNSNFQVITPGISLAKELAKDLRVGASARLYMNNMKSDYSGSIKAKSKTNGIIIYNSLYQSLDLNSSLLRLDFGLQKDLNKNFRLGVDLKTQTIKLSSSGNYSFAETSYTYNPSPPKPTDPKSTTVYSNSDIKDLNFIFNLPFELHTGIAYVGKRWDLEFDVKYIATVLTIKNYHYSTGNNTNN